MIPSHLARRSPSYENQSRLCDPRGVASRRRVSTLVEATDGRRRVKWKWQIASRRLTTGSVVHAANTYLSAVDDPFLEVSSGFARDKPLGFTAVPAKLNCHPQSRPMSTSLHPCAARMEEDEEPAAFGTRRDEIPPFLRVVRSREQRKDRWFSYVGIPSRFNFFFFFFGRSLCSNFL